jgi:hypothetical protein
MQTVGMFGGDKVQPQADVRKATVKPSMPIAEAVTGRTGFVYSPHTPGRQLVNVSRFTAGAEVRCPYTDKAFLVPDFTKLAKGPAAISYTDVAFRNFALADDFAPTRVPLRPAALKPTDPVAIIKRLGLDVFAMDQSHPSADVGPMGLLPFAKNVPGSPGMVHSPYARNSQLVDISGLMPGVEVTCPYSGKLFRVPAPLPITAALN